MYQNFNEYPKLAMIILIALQLIFIYNKTLLHKQENEERMDRRKNHLATLCSEYVQGLKGIDQ
jgi:hypothetical protein